jgi:4'-phosphopantetheinyl transferase EntD
MNYPANSADVNEAEFLPARQGTQTAPDVSGLFPDGVLTLVEHRDSWPTELVPAEEAQLGDVCGKRLAEFAAGRDQARRLIAALTGTAQPLLIGDYRQPLWPDGVIGSISHSDDFCAVAVASTQSISDLGIDVETLEALNPEVEDVVLTEAELHATESTEGWVRKLIFSIKESNYKCCYHMVKAFIDFKQCEVVLDMDRQAYQSRIICNNHLGKELRISVQGRWMLESGHIFTSAIIQ